MKFNFSIRTKLTLWYALVLSASLGLFGTSAYIYTKKTLSASLDATLQDQVVWLKQNLKERSEIKKKKRKKMQSPSMAKDLQKSSKHEVKTTPPRDSTIYTESPLVWTEADSIWYQIYEHAMRNRWTTLISQRDANGIESYRSDNFEDNDSLYIPPTKTNEVVLISYKTTNGEERRVAYSKDTYGEVWVAYPMSELDAILDKLLFVLLIISPITVLISIGGGWLIAKTSLLPVDNITRTAKLISATNLDQQIPHHHIDDEIGRLISTFNDMITRLRNSFENTRQFSMDASHELRTPLTIMRGEIELILRNDATSEEYRDVLLSILDEVIRMNGIIENLLLLAKSDLRLYKPNWETVDLHDILEELYEDGTLLATEKDITVVLEHNEQVQISGDKLRLRQLCLNLLDNAIKYTPEHGRIVLSLRSVNGNAVIKVSDTGIGIPPEDVTKIFNRFYRVDKARSRELGGSGLGLSIVKWIIDLHGGTIKVESKLNEGSTFIVTFPLQNKM